MDESMETFLMVTLYSVWFLSKELPFVLTLLPLEIILLPLA